MRADEADQHCAAAVGRPGPGWCCCYRRCSTAAELLHVHEQHSVQPVCWQQQEGGRGSWRGWRARHLCACGLPLRKDAQTPARQAVLHASMHARPSCVASGSNEVTVVAICECVLPVVLFAHAVEASHAQLRMLSAPAMHSYVQYRCAHVQISRIRFLPTSSTRIKPIHLFMTLLTKSRCRPQ
jgi:hypothetical protein